MKRILSIDFDYFLDTNLSVRNLCFPDGIDEMEQETLKKEWDKAYEKFPYIRNIGLITEYDMLLDYLKKEHFNHKFISDSHKDISILFNQIDSEEELEVIHIDFHHDNYITGGNKIDCANWVRHLMTNRKGKVKLKWIKRVDSEVDSLIGVFPYEMTDKFELEGKFDYIFACFSPEWTPPHLRYKFEEMISYFY